MEIQTAYEFVTAIWQFYKRHADVQTDDEYWAAVVEDADKLEQRYGSNKTMHEIILDVLEGLEREAKG